MKFTENVSRLSDREDDFLVLDAEDASSDSSASRGNLRAI